MENEKNIYETIFLYTGSIAGLISVFYVIVKQIFSRPHFKFDQHGSSGQIRKETGNDPELEFYDLSIEGTLRNCSLSPNSITEVVYVVWDEKKRDRSLSHGLMMGEHKSTTAGKVIKLPIYFKPKESQRIRFKASICLTGTHDNELVKSYRPVKPGSPFVLPKYSYDIIFTDTVGNIFDEKGKVRSKELMNLWWTLPNTSNHFSHDRVSAATMARVRREI